MTIDEMINVATLRFKCVNSNKMDCVDPNTHKRTCDKCEYDFSPMDLEEMMDALPELLVELKELRTVNPNEVKTRCEFESENGNCLINECMYEPHRLCDKVRLNIYKELENDLKNSVNLELYELGRADAIEEFEDLGKLYSEIRAEAIEELEKSIITKIKEWYWDSKMQEYHPDCDLFVNAFIVTVKETAEQLKEKNNE